jgi:hypothetical protein
LSRPIRLVGVRVGQWLDTLHALSRPVEVLRTARGLLSPDGHPGVDRGALREGGRFRSTEILPIEHDIFRVYRLHP